MARLTFPSDREVRLSSPYRGSAFVSAAGLTATVYSDSAGTTLADVQNFDTSANAEATFTIDTDSRLPLFLGPADGTDTLYVKVNNAGASVVPIYALEVSDLSAAVAAEAAARAAADTANAAALTAHEGDESNPHGVTKAQVGLGSVDNTSDANKPVSTAQQAALDLKAPLASPALTGTPTKNGSPIQSKAEQDATYVAERLGKLRRGYRDLALAKTAAAITPVFTPALGSASAIPSAVTYKPMNTDGTFTGLPLRSFGAYALAYGTAGIDVNFIRDRALTGDTGNNYSVWSIKWGMAGVTQFDVLTKMTTSGFVYRMRIDDRWVTEGEQYFFGSNGARYVMSFTGLDSGPHVYQLDLLANTWVGGICVAPAASLWKPEPPKVKAVLLGDSIAGGADGGATGGSVTFSTWWDRCCDLLGWDGRWNAGMGGTGMTVPGTGTQYINRLDTDVTPLGADVIVIAGSRNDNGATAPVLSTVQTAAAACYAKAKADNPNAVIIAAGAWMNNGAPTQNYIDANTGLRQAALAAGLPFIDYYTGKVYGHDGTVLIDGIKWVTGTGTSGINRTVTDAVLNSTTTVTSATANFVTGDVGRIVNATGIPAGTKIAARVSATQITLSAAATATASGVTLDLTNQRGDGNADWVTIGFDGVHPTQAGHQWAAITTARCMRAILDHLTPAAAGVAA